MFAEVLLQPEFGTLKWDSVGAQDDEEHAAFSAASQWILKKGLPSGMSEGMCSLCPGRTQPGWQPQCWQCLGTPSVFLLQQLP